MKTTDEKMVEFLRHLSETGDVSYSCELAHIGRTTVYLRRDEDADFKKDWLVALEKGTDAMEDEATRRGMRGVDEPVYQGGIKVGTVRKYSDGLLLKLLSARRPEKFRERASVEMTGKDGVPLLQIYLPGNERDDPPAAEGSAGALPIEQG